MTRRQQFVAGCVGAVVVALALGACTDEKVVYRDRTFGTPPTAALGFMGYSNGEKKLTVCGNCHVESQSQWEDTKHALAFSSLGTSATNTACQGCHTVNQLGNSTADNGGGYVGVKDA